VQGTQAQQQADTKCSDLLKLKIENISISDAAQVPAGKPYSLANPFAPPVVVTSLPEHCVIHGEVNHHKGADSKDYGDSSNSGCRLTGMGDCLFWPVAESTVS
jgi:hypothetical protein